MDRRSTLVPCPRHFHSAAHPSGWLTSFRVIFVFVYLSVIPYTGVGEGIRPNPDGGGAFGVPSGSQGPAAAHLTILKKRDSVHLDSDRSSKSLVFRTHNPHPALPRRRITNGRVPVTRRLLVKYSSVVIASPGH